jgi:hypothetical protein
MSSTKMPITRTAAADLLDIPSAELKGIFGNRRSLPLDEFCQAYIDQITTVPAEIPEMRLELEAASRELLVAGAGCRELKTELIDGESFRQAEVEQVVGFRLAAVVAKFNHLGEKLAMQLSGSSIGEIEGVVESARMECLEELIAFDGRDFACPRLFFEASEEMESNDGSD